MSNSFETTQDQTKGYSELSAQAYSIAIDAFAQANRRALDSLKSMFEIVSRPYTSSAPESAIRENLDRTNQLVSLTVESLQAAAQHNGEVLQQTAALASKWQETAMHSGRGAMQTMVSNLKFVKENSDAQYDEFSKRIDKMQTISQN